TSGTTALIIAAKAYNIELARCFLDRAADVNSCGRGALMTAAYTGQLEMAKLLLDRGAEINASDGISLQEAV
ncbi:hypothetical protein GQ607_014240, partial [Colletotrichum asianum]